MALRADESWRPAASWQALRQRADLLERIRRFFAARNVLEVSTPVAIGSGLADSNLHSIELVPGSDGRARFLHTSPEFAMKRLLAAGSGDIYQICPVFRQAERGRRHNPEFSMLEWYRVGIDHHQLMDEVEALVTMCLDHAAGPADRVSYRSAFLAALDLDPHRVDGPRLAAVAKKLGQSPRGLSVDDRDAWLDWLMSSVVAPGFRTDRGTFVYDYPASQCALARIQSEPPGTAARFELYWGDLELANGYHELGDADEQSARFEQERAKRDGRGEPAPAADPLLLQALQAGLPDCAGVALGLDRLVMLRTGADRIDEVLAFPWERA